MGHRGYRRWGKDLGFGAPGDRIARGAAGADDERVFPVEPRLQDDGIARGDPGVSECEPRPRRGFRAAVAVGADRRRAR